MARTTTKPADTAVERSATPKSKAKAVRAARPKSARATLRLYRHGVGDCHLLTVPRAEGKPFHMMIDCGLLLGGDKKMLEKAVRDIIEKTDGRVDVLVVTHEHWDHVSGFVDCRDLFAVPKKDDQRGRLSVDSVWMAWTENPEEEGAQAWERERQERKKKLKAAAAQAKKLAADGSTDTTGLGDLLGFFGVSGAELGSPFAAGDKVGGTGEAFEIARSLASKEQVYCRPSKWTPYSPEKLPGMRIYALGPPDTLDEIKRLIREGEVYHQEKAAAQDHAMALLDEALFGAAGLGDLVVADPDRREDHHAPFDPAYCFSLATLYAQTSAAPGSAGADEATLRRFLADHYMEVDTTLPRQFDGWRRIDTDWLMSAQGFGLQLDNMTNNTSLALAIEFGADGPVLLFAADAQVGNWLSWHDRVWNVDDGKGGTRFVTGKDLLRRTTFYKVGHHGSHNATLKQKGVELMENDDLVAFIPVNQDHAKKMRWNHMPLPALIKALEERSAGRVLRSDQEPTAEAQAAFGNGTFKLTIDPLYFELSFDWPR
ncbi:MAG TPA: MBL fold metallo-hydrolase [Vineibacter sp.]|nr:MBL fold metallo-hydrolase [Vineibacter sp.]